jgi:hypothetical protein
MISTKNRMTLIRSIVVVLSGLALTSSSAHAASNNAATTIEWSSQTVLKGQVTIPAGQTVTVTPKAKIIVNDGTKIIIDGRLIAPSGLSLTGKSWSGLVVTGTALLSDFHETGASTSFRVGPTGSLTIHGGDISGVLGASDVEGKFVADSLRYDKGAGGGINSNNGTGSITIDNSFLTGAGRETGDFFGLYGVKSITLTNSKMTGAHCAFHVTGLQDMKLDHVSIYENSYGFMMYGSSNGGKKTITNTTIKNNSFGFDEGSSSTQNGSILISNSTIRGNGKDLGLYTGKVSIVSPK